MALIDKGATFSWGHSAEGQLGQNADSLIPNFIEALKSFRPIVGIAAGGCHSAAVGFAGELVMWGRGSDGQLGDGRDRFRLRFRVN